MCSSLTMVVRSIALVSCGHCGRKFATERLGVHQRICTPSQEGFRATVVTAGGRPTVAAHWSPLPSGSEHTEHTLARCEHCARSFSPDCLASHQFQCRGKRTEELDASQKQLRPHPESEHVELVLEACEHCGRTFASDRRAVHQRVYATCLPIRPLTHPPASASSHAST